MLDDLTIKPRPRTKLVNTPETRCFVCYRKFKKKKINQKVCSRLCYQSLMTARQRVNSIRARGLTELPPPIAHCVICGDEFERRQVNYVCCGKLECKKERAKQSYKAWKPKAHGV